MAREAQSIAGLKVLVVDDTATNRQLLQVFLTKLGCRVAVAEDGAQAVEAFARAAPDLVLMDVMMPVMDGFEATRRIKALCGSRWVPVVFLSALDKDENLVAGLEAGGDDYLAKPINFVVLRAKLQSLARTLRLQKRLEQYRDAREEENALAAGIIDRLLLRQGLADPQVHHWLAPASDFSGDVLAAARAPDGRLCAMLADATGHGLAAAISVLPVLTTFYGLVEQGLPLAAMAREVNRRLMAFMPTGRFVAATLVCVARGRAEVWLGGMPGLLLLADDGRVLCALASNHLPLGIVDFDESMGGVETIDCPPGSQLALFSDGLCEATDGRGMAFGLPRLVQTLAAAPAPQRLAAVQAALVRHGGGTPAHDDVSLLLIDC